MEKAMLQNHGVGYAQYSRQLSKRMNVERAREKSYMESQRVVQDVERQVHR
ncbi:hypothetical protein [Gracilibacillus dipsosauri]|uniref:hypothetical protein n=1 Tax=Gracilibacillus dipsosauri TaxID=178340 RepID=UPI00240A45B6